MADKTVWQTAHSDNSQFRDDYYDYSLNIELGGIMEIQ